MKKLIFTIDVEEWYHAENLRPYLRKSDYDLKHSTLKYTYEILDFLDEVGAKGTFFFLGCVARNNPDLVNEVVKRGHEIASHGLDHQLLWKMNKNETFYDISTSTKIIEDISGKKILGYRSPCFSQNPYIADALYRSGYQYSSMSIESTFHDRYESNYFKSKNSLKDFPMPVSRLGPFKVVSTGGGWFRFFPIFFQKFLLDKSKADPLIFYCHPWDFGKNFWGNSKIPVLNKFRHTVGTGEALKKLENFSFLNKTLSDYL